MRISSHHEISSAGFAISIVGGVISGRSHAVISAAAVGKVTAGANVVKDSTEDGTRVDTAIHVAATVSLTAFFVLSIKSLAILEIDFLGQ